MSASPKASEPPVSPVPARAFARFDRRRLLLGGATLLAPFTTHAESASASKERDINPCDTPDPGFGAYERWNRDVTSGQMLAPKKGGVSGSGAFDLVIHFHGHEPARKEWVRVMKTQVLVATTLGIGSGVYESTFRDANAFPRLVESVEAVMAARSGRKTTHARKIALSAWSAGYGAVRSLLSQPSVRERIDSVILLDALHCDYAGEALERADLDPFVRYARDAAANKRLMVVTHSSIVPPGYASTTETANFLIRELGGKARPARPRASDPLGLELISRYDRGDFHVRGYAGQDKPDHCAHLGLLRDILQVHLVPRWSKKVAAQR
jgi:hypothetical protein